MILKFISLLNFKNHGNLKVDFINEVNCFLGNNGVGKTNLLDAIYYLSFSKSYYNSLELDNVKNGEDFFMIKGLFMSDNTRVSPVSIHVGSLVLLHTSAYFAFSFSDIFFSALASAFSASP